MKSRLRLLLLIAVTLSGLLGATIAPRSNVQSSLSTLPRLAPSSTNFTSPFWSPTRAGTGPSVTTTSQFATVSFPTNSANDPSLLIFGAGLSSVCPISGDFDVQVGFRLLNWTYANGVRVGLASSPGPFFVGNFGSTPPFAVERTSFGNPGDFPGVTREVYLTDFLDRVQQVIPTSDLTGALRLTRTSGIATGYYLNSSKWVAIHSGPAITQNVNLDLVAWSHDYAFTHTFVKLAFDNFTINQGSPACPGITLSPASGPVGTNVHAHVTGFPSSSFTPDQVLMSFDGNFLGIATNLNGTFDFTFNVPEVQPGSHLVKALDEFSSASLSASFTVTTLDTLAISLNVGTLYFPGESAAVYTLATLSGTPLNSTSVRLQLLLTRPDGTVVTLNNTFVGAGLFKSVYAIPRNGLIGTYAIVAKASVRDLQNVSAIAAFEVKPSWLTAQGPALATTGATLLGVVSVAAVLWRRRLLGGEND